MGISVKVDDHTYHGFSCPHVGLNTSFLYFVVVEHAREAVKEYVERPAGGGKRREGGLCAVLDAWLQSDGTFDAVWCLPFGEFLASLLSDEPKGLERSAAGLALRLHEDGLEGEWHLELEDPSYFRFDRWLLPASSALHVLATGHTVTIRTKSTDGNWCLTTFDRKTDDWSCSDALVLPVLASHGMRWPILVAECISSSIVAEKLFKGEAYGAFDGRIEVEVDRLLNVGNAAIDLIAEWAPSYVSWVGLVVRNLLPLPFTGGVLNSASGFLAPGVVTVSNQDHRAILAEMLVHEASHQYFYISKRLGSVDDGTDTALHFSPFRDIGRPLLYIVFTYHAFGNVLLFFRLARARGIAVDEPGVYGDEQIEALERKLAVLERTLKASQALTPLGRSLWEPLYAEIHK